MIQDPTQDRNKKVDERGIFHHLTELPKSGVTVTAVKSTKKDRIKSACTQIKNELNPKSIECVTFSIDATHRHLFGKPMIEIIQRDYGAVDREQLSFYEACVIEENHSVMKVRNMKWDSTLSGNRNNTHLILSVNPAGVHLLQANINDNAGFFGSTHMLAHAKSV